MRVAILGIEPIEPPEGGSRLRLLGLHHALGPGIEASYTGAFHWRGPGPRRVRHGPGLEEITIPFSAAHLAAVDALEAEAGGSNVLDASFPRLGALSEAYCDAAREAAAGADVVIFSHPWAFAVASEALRPGRQLVVYDAHNVEAVRWRVLLGGTPVGRELAEEVAKLEARLCHAADLVLACSPIDRTTLVRIHRIAHAKTRLFPNGVFAGRILPAGAIRRRLVRARFGVGSGPVALFIGGLYPPNVEAAEFLRDHLAPACPEVTFVLVGDAGLAVARGGSRATLPGNLRIVGRVDEATKLRWLQTADLGVNPMFSGFGTNIKMLDYMAAGLAVATTPTGARGIEGRFASAEAAGLADQVSALASSPALRDELGRRGRDLVVRRHDWANLSAELGATLLGHGSRKARTAPFFSVTVATLDRAERLRRLLDLLAIQRERDFEVVVVDQSEEPFVPPELGLDVIVLHTPVRGAARARNLAATVARGRVLVFVDDDCEPSEGWLAEARAVLERNDAVGLEGRVMSARSHDPGWRTVDNYGVEGLGFMSSNLFVDAEAFHAVGGFDPAFDEHDFRYDTDLGWRLQERGDVPFSEAAFVYHPPWPRTIARESRAARDRFFEGDALLLRKHPERYRELFLWEGHWRRPETFRSHLLRGARWHGVALPEYVREKLADADGTSELLAPAVAPAAGDSRRRGIRQTALRPESARARFLVDLRRARRSIPGSLPASLDLCERRDRAGCALRGWSRPRPAGSWTVGPVAQLLIVPEELPQAGIELSLHVVKVAFEACRVLAVAIDVNGVVERTWRFRRDESWESLLRLAVPEPAFARLSGCLVTFRIGSEPAEDVPGEGDDQPRFALRRIGVRALSASEAPA